MTRPLNVQDYRALARRRLPRAFFEFLDRGTEDETLLSLNRQALDRLRLRPAVLTDVRQVDASTRLFGREMPMPLVVAPTGVADMMHYRGELAVARAAAAAGVPFTLATSSTTRIEDIAAAATAGFWLQLYVWEDREATWTVVDRARAAGAEALVVTVDTPVMANREYNDRNGFAFPVRASPRLMADMALHPRWLFGTMARYWLTGGAPRFVNYPARIGGKVTKGQSRMANAASVTWDDIARFRDRWPGRLILKGILDPADAERAGRVGADGVIVSNHGGRMFDAAPPSIEALGPVVQAAPAGLSVLFDSGVRRGTDILRALSLGASAVLVGRATLYGVAAAGSAGAEAVLALLRTELLRSMALAGRRTLGEIDATCLWPGASGKDG